MKPRKPIKRRKPIARVSKRKRAQDVVYAKERAEHLSEYPNCQIGPIIKAAGHRVRCLGVATHVHHSRGRHGNTCDRAYFFSSCSGECHPQWVHQTNVKEAYEIGLLLAKGGSD